ncbi:hypothetical protein BJX99DRAFT_239662 [Aspergillus californicus]
MPHGRIFAFICGMLLLQWMQASAPSDNVDPIDETFENRVRDVGSVGDVLVQLGSHLQRILLGEIDPRPILLENNLLYRL